MKFSKQEVNDIIKAWLLLSVAFAIVIGGFSVSIGFFVTVAIAALTVGVGFLLHELSHKLVAQKYHCWAEFRAFNNMLLLALAMSFFGFVFAAPGAVFIRGQMTRQQYGRISAAGPITNYIVALLFLALSFASIPLVRSIAAYGFMINSWLGLFNMIPFGEFDGRKIVDWNKYVYAGMAAVGVGMLLV